MHAGTLPVAPAPSADLTRRRRAVEARLREVGRPRLARRAPPPDGRLGADEQPMRRLRETLIELGPVFAGFGRYLATRLDLLPRRDCLELAAIPGAGEALDEREVASVIQRELGAVPDRRFFAFGATPTYMGRWTQEHTAWLSPGVPVTVRIVRPDATAVMAADLPLLPLLAPWLGLSEAALAPAIHDFATSLRRRLDQEHQAASLARLAADVPVGGLFHAPGAYNSHCSPGILTLERVEGTPAGDAGGQNARDREAAGGLLGRRIAAAWLRQATIGQILPYDFSLDDIVLAGDRLVLRSASFEPHSAAARARFLNC